MNLNPSRLESFLLELVSYMQPQAASSIGSLLSSHPNVVDKDKKKRIIEVLKAPLAS